MRRGPFGCAAGKSLDHVSRAGGSGTRRAPRRRPQRSERRSSGTRRPTFPGLVVGSARELMTCGCAAREVRAVLASSVPLTLVSRFDRSRARPGSPGSRGAGCRAEASPGVFCPPSSPISARPRSRARGRLRVPRATGSPAREDEDRAVLTGLFELVERDAFADRVGQPAFSAAHRFGCDRLASSRAVRPDRGSSTRASISRSSMRSPSGAWGRARSGGVPRRGRGWCRSRADGRASLVEGAVRSLRGQSGGSQAGAARRSRTCPAASTRSTTTSSITRATSVLRRLRSSMPLTRSSRPRRSRARAWIGARRSRRSASESRRRARPRTS